MGGDPGPATSPYIFYNIIRVLYGRRRMDANRQLVGPATGAPKSGHSGSTPEEFPPDP